MRRRYRWLAGAAIIIGGAGIALWFLRQPIATRFVDDALVRAGVDAAYRIETVGINHQRLTGVRLGDPARPDLIAREVDLWLEHGWSGPRVTRVRARGVRLVGHYDGARMRFGQLDRLLPAPSDEPLTLPDMAVDLRDAAAHVTTPWGAAVIGLSGNGHARDDFAGALALRASRLAAGPCAFAGLAGDVRLTISDASPKVTGPVRVRQTRCDAGSTSAAIEGLIAQTDLRLAADWQSLSGDIGWRSGAGRTAHGEARSTQGAINLTGSVNRVAIARGWMAFNHLASPQLHAGRMVIAGTARHAAGDTALRLGVAGRRMALAPAWRQRLAAVAERGDAPLLGPLLAQAGAALDRAGQNFALEAPLLVDGDAGGWRVQLGQASIAAPTGAAIDIAGAPAAIWTSAGGLALDGTATMAGGGLPQARLALRRAGPAAPISGSLAMAPYAAQGAVLAMTPLQFTVDAGGTTRFAGGAAISGPLPDGRADRLAFPFRGTLAPNGMVTISGECRPVRWQSLTSGALALGAQEITLCGEDAARLVRVGPAGVSGGLTIPDINLRGRMGGSAFALDSGPLRWRMGDPLALNRVAVQLGDGDSAVRLNVDRLSSAFGGQGPTGELAGGAGRIGTVPFLLSDMGGRWRWRDGALEIAGAARVDDAAQPDRFEPMQAPDIRLRLADGAIGVTGRLRLISTGTPVADVTIRHRLASGSGDARFALVPLRFASDGLQPEALTPLALGVVANVDGVVHGDGIVRWSPAGVTSEGDFSTPGTNLAAAFGPVSGLSGRIHFDDLIALSTPPGQEVALASVNPGIVVVDGRVRYQLLAGQRARIEGGRWDFAGGQLLLQPSLISFGNEEPRRLVFDVSGVDAALFLQRYGFENISATGVFDGVLPTVFDGQGGRVEGGILVVRPGGGTLAYVGELSTRDLGYFGNMAFGALRSLRYDDLAIRMEGRIDGEMLTSVQFQGLGQGAGAVNNFLTRRLAALPFAFNIQIKAPFRGLLTSARGFYDPTVLIDQNLPALIRAQRAAEAEAAAATAAGNPSAPPARPSVQPPESGNRP